MFESEKHLSFKSDSKSPAWFMIGLKQINVDITKTIKHILYLIAFKSTVSNGETSKYFSKQKWIRI